VISATDNMIHLLPSLETYDRIHLGVQDVLIHAPGFEDRTMAIASGVLVTPETHLLLLDYRPYNADNRLQGVRNAFLAQGLKDENIAVFEYDRFDPNDHEARLLSYLAKIRAQRVTLDVSTMSKLAILLSLSACRELNLETTILYAEAEVYGPSREEFEEARNNREIHRPTIQIFTGVHGVVRATSLASVAMQGQPTAALVFMSFNDALTQILLNTVYPSRLFLINGRPPVHSWREQATAWIHDQVRREWPEDNPVTSQSGAGVLVPQRAVSTLDYRETVALLIELYWHLSPTHRVLLAPAGSKMQAVGCFLVKALHPDIHIEYPSPEGFLPQYSSGIARRWMLRLGAITGLLAAVAQEERRTFLELSVR
jgi:hypothetical protein